MNDSIIKILIIGFCLVGGAYTDTISVKTYLAEKPGIVDIYYFNRDLLNELIEIPDNELLMLLELDNGLREQLNTLPREILSIEESLAVIVLRIDTCGRSPPEIVL